MNVLRVIISMDPAYGGPCQGIRNSVPELEKLGVHNEVVCLDSPDVSFKDAFIIHKLGPAKTPWAYNKKLLPWLINNLKRFDAVIVHGLWLYPGYAVWKVIKKYRQIKRAVPKFYVMPHGMLDPYFQKANGRKLKALRNKLYWKLIEAKVVNDADAVLFTCEAELMLAREPFSPYHPKKESNVGYGVAAPPPFYQNQFTEAFYATTSLPKDKPYFLFLSRIHEKKGVDILIDAYAGAYTATLPLQQYPALVIAGPGLETPYGKRLQQKVENNPELQQSIFFTGMLSGDSKWGAFYNCEVFILPSHQENFGIAVVEALACKKPVLISNQVNIWREIHEAGAGLIADDNFIGTKSLIDSWQALQQAEKILMGEKAFDVYEKNFKSSSAAIKLSEIL